MSIDILTLCDSVHEYNGKLVIVGAFNRLYLDKTPDKYTNLNFVARMRWDENMIGNHKVQICIKKVGEEIYILRPNNLDIKFESRDKITTINLFFKMNDAIIPTYGKYIVSLKVDEEHYESELDVEQKKQKHTT